MSDNINWYPGHMAKTMRRIKESLSLVDGVTELRDARLPFSSTNSELNLLTQGKPKIVLLSKADLADEKTTSKWLSFYASKGIKAIAADCKSGRGLKNYNKAVRESLAGKIKSNTEKGMPGKPLRIMVVGIPNTGKSSFINRIAKNGKAKTEDRAGVTLRTQWYVIDKDIELLDTPGVLPPKIENQLSGLYLAFTGGIKDEILDTEALAAKLLELLSTRYPKLLAERYKINDLNEKTGSELLEYICKKRGMLISGGEADCLRGAEMLFDELRAGKIGKISFEEPENDI